VEPFDETTTVLEPPKCSLHHVAHESARRIVEEADDPAAEP
jgi:hypothetical protein